MKQSKKKKKELKEMRKTSETSGTMLSTSTFEPQVSHKKKTKGKGMRKYVRR